jgi:hypothetical protein
LWQLAVKLKKSGTMKRLSLLILSAAGLLFNASAQSSFLKSKDAYLGQKPPGDKPEMFAGSLLMKKDTFPMGRVAFSQDGKEFYYDTNNTWFDSKAARTRYFKFENGKWDGPFVLNEHYNTPTFSIDESKLYFVGGKRDSTRYIVWQSTRKPDGGWTDPSVFLAVPFALYNFMPTASGTIYGGSRVPNDPNRKDMDICELKISPGDTVIRSLGQPINTTGFEGDFFVAKDESYMIVSTKETKDFESELWISFRKPDGAWAQMLSLGPEINNGLAHRWGQYVSADGKYLFYSTGHSPKDCRIVWVRFDKLFAKLKKENQGLTGGK